MPDTERRAWVGCLACYNDGRLTGEWVPANEAGDLTSDTLHEHADRKSRVAHLRENHEELWVMDQEGLPVNEEMAPVTAQRIAEVCDAIEADGHPIEAVQGWAEHTGEGFPHEWDAPTRQAFEDAFAGVWESLKDYAGETICETGWSGLDGAAITQIFPYLDMDLIEREFEQDHHTHPAPEYRVYVFRSN